MSFAAVKFAIIAVAVIVVIGGMWWISRLPNRSRTHPDRLRLPVFVAIAGWILVATGGVMALAGFTAWEAQGLWPMRIASSVVFVVGLGFVIVYRNWYVAPRAREIAFRTGLGRELVHPYTDVTDFRTGPVKGQPMLMLQFSSGKTLRLNLRTYDMTPTLMAIDTWRRTRRWPGEA
ncbi:hypothetical protein GCM10025768_00570 [Microbacterium pseudoresistens]|uniref:Uncharacterized protein n=1 Tax=Microbacterium pseudoresistens TaxID=640634 RepID=A0A7Y9ETX9_9MICO|nr:hypothetical protein [Microbacterium pseudoresistens]NYD53892.1 hypothetical protein [Microbacterium pseudoresistens]